MRILGTITETNDNGINFVSEIREDDDGRIFFTADADIDADGANGQNGAPAAYKADDTGTELLKNGGMRIDENGKVVCISDDARDIVILADDNEPKVFDAGIIASMTGYKYPNVQADDPAAYADAETVPYIVVPPIVISQTVGTVIGCRARATWNGISIDCVVADEGPDTMIGELSIAAARALGIPSDPRGGGCDEADVLYELWPGEAAPGFVLQPSHRED